MKEPDRRPSRDNLAIHEDESIHRGMMEKYLHSMGAHLCDEDRFDEAIRYFRRALAFGDEPFTHYHLGLAYAGKEAYDKAIKALTRAIELFPSAPEYYYERALAWDKAGNEAMASSDYRKALAIDENYGYVEKIRAAAEFVEAGLSDRSILEGSCPIVSCPAFCCHFSADLGLHGVHIGAWKLHSIRLALKEKGFPENEFIEKMAYGGEKYLRMLIPPHYAIKQGHERFVYYPARGSNTINKNLLKDLPKSRDYRTLVWITENARPCVFLRDQKCMIHNTGDETGLEPCKQFLCLTGFVFVVLKHLGMVAEEWLSGRQMAELNTMAPRALILLAEGADGYDALASLLKRQTPSTDRCRGGLR